MNCTTSLKMAESRPPAITQMPTVRDETQMLKWIFHPRVTFMITAMEYMLMPLMRMVITANDIADTERAPSL